MNPTPHPRRLSADLDATAVDLFAGAGGATLGLQRAGFRVLAAIEIDHDAAATYTLNHPKVYLIATDIRDIDEFELREELGLHLRELTLLKACPPCQGFSSLGARQRDDERNDLTLEIWRFIAAFRPAAFLIENVPGIRTDTRLAHVIRQARGSGYHVRSFGIDAVDVGVPQRRKRHIVIGVNKRSVEFPIRLIDIVPNSYKRRTVSAGEALEYLDRRRVEADNLDRSRNSRRETVARMGAVPVGGTRFDLPKRHQLRCHRNLDLRVATASYGRIRAAEPAPTMTTRCTTPACGPFIHPTEDRGLTLREAATLQTFPLRYRFHGGYDSIERQIGNAVPVQMAAALGHAVLKLLGK